MGLYSYQALAKDGKRVRGTLDAASQESVREQLIKMGLYPVAITLTKEEQAGGIWQRIRQFFARRVTPKDKILFTKQLAVLLKSGVPLLQALELLIDQFQGRLQRIIVDLRDGIKEGGSLAQGLSHYPNVFDTIYIQLVRAGEATGKLEVILERLITYLERRQEVRKKVRSALRYPLIQLGIIILVVVALLTFVLPNLTAQFTAQKMELPFTTRFLMATSDLLLHYWYIILIMLAVTIVIFRYWKATPHGGKIYDRIKLKLPLIGYFARMGTVVQFARTLGILVESGVNFAESLDIVVKIVDNRILADVLNKARDKIIKQGRIAEFLRQTDIFPPIAIYLINTGEQSGQLDAMLLTVAQNYEDDLSEYAETLSSLIEPIMLLVMAIVVGFVVLSVVQPMLQQAQTLKF